MAIIWFDGFDHYGNGGAGITNLLEGPYAQAILSQFPANVGPGGVGSAIGFTPSAIIRKVLPGNRIGVGVGQRIYFQTSLPIGNGGCRLLEWRDGANNTLATLYVESTGALTVRAGSSNAGAIWGRTDPIIVPQSWQHVEAFLLMSATVGELRIGVNGITLLDLDGLNTGATQTAQIASLYSASGVNWYMRDLYVWDTTGTDNNSGMQGDRQVITTFPTSDGPNQDWTPSTGVTGWNILAENPPNDATYVEALLDGDISDFGMGDIDTDITSISAIRLSARIKKTDAGIGTVKLGVSSSAVIAESAEIAVSTEFIFYSAIFEKDPNTTNRWTPTGVNAALTRLNRVQ